MLRGLGRADADAGQHEPDGEHRHARAEPREEQVGQEERARPTEEHGSGTAAVAQGPAGQLARVAARL